MKTSEQKALSKISVKVWPPLLLKLEERFEALCLRRDPYLNKVLAIELQHLDDEVSIPNSLLAKNFIEQHLGLLERKVVSLTLAPELVLRLNEICQRKRIPRDAFFNRLFLLLVAGPRLINRILFNGDDIDWKRWLTKEYGENYWWQSCYPLADDIDPFWALRDALEPDTNDSSALAQVGSSTDTHVPQPKIYSIYLAEQLKDVDIRGMNCFVPDHLIPETEAAIAHQQRLKELADLLNF